MCQLRRLCHTFLSLSLFKLVHSRGASMRLNLPGIPPGCRGRVRPPADRHHPRQEPQHHPGPKGSSTNLRRNQKHVIGFCFNSLQDYNGTGNYLYTGDRLLYRCKTDYWSVYGGINKTHDDFICGEDGELTVPKGSALGDPWPKCHPQQESEFPAGMTKKE